MEGTPKLKYPIMRIGNLMNKTTVIIKTIGRKTLSRAIESAKREGFKPIVISDGVKCHVNGARSVRLGHQWGYYGGMAANVGAALAETEFITFLDDDDEFAPGAGEVIRSKLKEKPEVDVWIGGVRFNKEINIHNTSTGEVLLASLDISMNGDLGIIPGNVSMPTYRTSIFSKIPFTDSVPAAQANLTDFYHIPACSMGGLHIDWFGSVIYLVRPELGGVNGEGQ